MRPLAPVLAPLLMVAWSGRAQDAAELEVDHNVTSAFVTPHTAWAKPYAPGTTRVLFFVNGRGNLYWRPKDVPRPIEKQAGPRMNVTGLLDFGKENEMIVWVNNIKGPGGIWKPVKLAVKRQAP